MQDNPKSEVNGQDEDALARMVVRWNRLMEALQKDFGKRPSLEGVLYLIGIRELGALHREFTKEEKRDLIHIAICAILAPSGYYRLSHHDADGWPHWEVAEPLPFIDIFSQEIFLKSHIVDYFSEIYAL